jgi:hypothetical protein
MQLRLWIVLLAITLFLGSAMSQENPESSARKSNSDTTTVYFKDYSDLLALRIYLLAKLNTLEIYRDNRKAIYQPNGIISIGGSFNFKGIGLGLGIGLPSSQESIRKYGKTRRLDAQVSIFSRKIGGDGYFQLYRGYYMANPEDFIDWEQDYQPQLPGMEIFSIGINAFYIFNNKRFSYGAAFSRVQHQLKSAGSPVAGLFFNYDDVSTESGFIPQEFPDTIGTDLDITSFRYYAVGITAGYMYNIVFSKSFFANLSALPGFGYKQVELTDNDGITGTESVPHGQVGLRAALAYEHRLFYAGFTGATLIRTIKYKDFTIDLSTEHFRFFIGTRLDVGAKREARSAKR